MSKQSGLGDNLYAGGFDLSGDINSLSSISGSLATIDVTDITQSAHERRGGQRDGALSLIAYFDNSAGRAHPVLAALPTADVGLMYCRGTALGSPAACMVGKQLNYDPTRSDAGELTMKVDAQANGFGLEWAQLLTAGKRTDTAATNGTSLDTTASASFGGTLYLQVFALTGTDVTIKLQDSADNATFADVSGAALLVNSTTPQAARVQLGLTATIRRYVRIATTTSGGFTAATFGAALAKNVVATVF